MTVNKQELLRKLPAVDALLSSAELSAFIEQFPRKIVVDSIQSAIQQMREVIIADETLALTEEAITGKITEDAIEKITVAMSRHYRRVINAAGIILHTGLGRAVLPKAALDQIYDELKSYSMLQVDPETGGRSKRDVRVEYLLKKLTGAEAATVVNNNAAATSIVLNTFARGKEVIVSRGQLVEIGGSFRLPDVISFSGAKLVEVGATNKTHAKDYKDAITENTAAIMRIHPSNYKIQGFSSEVGLEEIARIAHSNDLVMIDDVGAGSLIDMSRFGFESEPTLSESISRGADVVTCSADKLIGASQGGIILGNAPMIDAIRKNQFARIVRVGKLTLAALEATLELFLDDPTAISEVPTLRMLSRSIDDVAMQAKRIAAKLKKNSGGLKVTTIDGFSQVGSGSLPAQNLPTMLVAVEPVDDNAQSLARRLRLCDTPIFTRIHKDHILIDSRTLQDGDEKILVETMLQLLNEKP